MPEPWPAPDWIRTRWPERCSSSTPTGVMATRDSCVLISFGTPTTYLLTLGIAEHPSLERSEMSQRRAASDFPPHSGRGGRVNQEQQAGGEPVRGRRRAACLQPGPPPLPLAPASGQLRDARMRPRGHLSCETTIEMSGLHAIELSGRGAI